ncbi:MAG: hypothetical protein A6F70_03720 [Cycloclasticus sp. symbiont of Bathymodiolus heckerae]|nr:MAG: hypothetical protein A6F70_03720 [Cycloclasticus sp. symbiont of Bathymodiolus heckerae]
MKLVELNNAYEVKGMDIDDDAMCIELGRLVADKCIILLDQKVSEKRLFEIQSLWGSPSRSLIEEYVSEKVLQGTPIGGSFF